MGSCSSADRDTDSAIRYRLGVNYKGRRVFIPSPTKENPLEGKKPDGEYGSKSFESVDKGETFFDSQVWLDSDCEDDFFSVKGDLTPSRGNTPIHHLSAPLTPQLASPFFIDKHPDSKSEPSPTGRKKLGELFRETLEVEEVADAPNSAEIESNKKLDLYTTNTDQTLRSINGAPHQLEASSFCSREVTPSRDPGNRKEKIWKTQQCCLPSFQNFGFDNRRQKMSPGPCAA